MRDSGRDADGEGIRALSAATCAAAADHFDDPVLGADLAEPALPDPEDRWTIVLGTGYRATAARLEPAAAQRVRAATVARLRADGLRELRTDVVYARSRKPGGA